MWVVQHHEVARIRQQLDIDSPTPGSLDANRAN
jgi:hypothetical protein